MTGVELIAAERQRQLEEEGWTPEHDDEHDGGALAMAAICYASPVRVYCLSEAPGSLHFDDPWPWDAEWDKRPRNRIGDLLDNYFPADELAAVSREERIRQIAKAGALLAAEIDRLQRAAAEGAAGTP